MNLVLYHVGGEGDCGPAMSILKMYPDTKLVVFDAREDTDDHLQAETNGNITVINRCIDDKIGEADFYINKFPVSSSLMPVSPLAKDENPGYPHCKTWGENAAVDRIVRLKTTTIDEVVSSGLAPAPDILSIDAQGAELRILKGASSILPKLSAIITEIEFSEIYEGQCLFDEQMAYLRDFAFRFTSFVHEQHWHPGPELGLGFHTVGEALWLRYTGDFRGRGAMHFTEAGPELILKIITVACAFQRFSYAKMLCGILEKHYGLKNIESVFNKSFSADPIIDPETKRLMDEIDILKSSTSWKVTAPMRALKEALSSFSATR